MRALQTWWLVVAASCDAGTAPQRPAPPAKPVIAADAAISADAGAPEPPVAAIAPIATTAPASDEITQLGVGPITATTRANAAAVRALFRAARVATAKLDAITVVDVFEHGAKLLRIVPEDNGTTRLVEITSPRFVVAGRGWHVGDTFRQAATLTDCMCNVEIGPNAMCWRSGDHVWIEIEIDCDDIVGTDMEKVHDIQVGHSDRKRLLRLDDRPIAKLVWFATALQPLRD